MDVGVEAAGREDLALAGDDLRARADRDRHPRLDGRVARLADRRDAPILQRDVSLHDPPMIEDQRVGDHRVGGTLGARRLPLPHAVTDHLATAELHLLAVDREVALDLDEQRRVGEPHAVADSGAEHVGIGGAGEGGGHGSPFDGLA